MQIGVRQQNDDFRLQEDERRCIHGIAYSSQRFCYAIMRTRASPHEPAIVFCIAGVQAIQASGSGWDKKPPVRYCWLKADGFADDLSPEPVAGFRRKTGHFPE